MSRIQILFLVLQFPLFSCLNGKNVIVDTLDPNPDYIADRSKFDKKLTEHFPDTLVFKENTIVCNMNKEKNNVGFLLYEYNVNRVYIEQTKAKLKNRFIAQYEPTDKCLLVVNRFETRESYENYKLVTINDSSLIDLPCYRSLYPIPHFMDFKNPPRKGPVWLDKSFTIFVLEADSKNEFEKFQMTASTQMPIKWKNGYSRGIAISEKEMTVVHWCIIW